MVTDTEEIAQEPVDQVPDQEAQTESVPEVTFPDAAAEPVEEAAAPEVETPDTEPEKPLTRAEIEAMLRQERQEAERTAAEKIRRERQREEGRRAAEAQRTAQEKQELAEVLGVELYKRGLSETNPDELMPILDRYASKREGHVTNRTLQEVAQAFEFAAADVLGLETDIDLSPRAETYAASLQPFVESIFQRALAGVAESGDFIPKKDLAKYVDAEIERRNAKAREGKEPLKRVEGNAAPTVDNSYEARLDRISKGRETEDDRTWWANRPRR